MSDVYFKASLQNTLDPEVGTFDNVDNKEGTFTLEDGEYYLTNNTDTCYRVYYPTKDITYSVGFTTIEFDVNYSHSYSSLIHCCLSFHGDDGETWYGIGAADSTLYFTGGAGVPNRELVTSPSTWLHVKCIFDYNPDQSIVHIYIDNVEVDNFTISNDHDIKYIYILGNHDDNVPLIPDAKIKNITIYGSKKHYLDTIGLTSLWSKIKSLFATKTELASLSPVAKSGDYNDLSNKPVLPQTIYDLVPDGAANHRNFYRGKDLTAAFDSGEFSTHVADGSFHDIFPGDYITKQITVPQILKADGTTEYIAQKTYTVNFIIADLDIWLNHGDMPMTVHHAAIVPESVVFNSCMNKTNTTEGGYKGSFMNTNVMPAFATGLLGAFGNDHILSFRFFDTNAVDNNLKSGGIANFTGATYWGNNGHDWVSLYCRLMTETMVYGAPITASCAADEIMGGVQMAAFRLNSNLFYNGQVYWLSDVVSSAYFARFGFVGGGGVGADSASLVFGVRPFALLC